MNECVIVFTVTLMYSHILLSVCSSVTLSRRLLRLLSQYTTLALTHYTTKLQVRDPHSLEIYFKHYSLTVTLLTAILLYLANSLTDCRF